MKNNVPTRIAIPRSIVINLQMQKIHQIIEKIDNLKLKAQIF